MIDPAAFSLETLYDSPKSRPPQTDFSGMGERGSTGSGDRQATYRLVCRIGPRRRYVLLQARADI
jgi:hypothetical protein